jgi:hypothetical protein
MLVLLWHRGAVSLSVTRVCRALGPTPTLRAPLRGATGAAGTHRAFTHAAMSLITVSETLPGFSYSAGVLLPVPVTKM